MSERRSRAARSRRHPARKLVRGPLAVTALSLAIAVGGASTASAGSLSVRDSGYLGYVHSSGASVIDEGRVRGSLSGKARVAFVYDGSPTVRASFVISGPGWSLRGEATCHLNSPNSLAPSFRGGLTLTGGTGRYAHAHGRGELFGVYYRRSYALEVQAIGRLAY